METLQPLFHTCRCRNRARFPAGHSARESDADNITCYTPEGLRALKMPAVEAQLRFSCLIQLYKQDYIFLCLIGFCIFFAGTVAAWLAGVCAVIYKVHTSKGEDGDEEEEEDTVT